ncbi:ankyrin repeat and zinc finger domain-containing protein 1 isoform X4 [Helianthus annuus]|uniref:ankyrin repeat and zinc finger domain-containing protein 1 isoform X4 n=1 Tax=Helianthus annuus TaxID=4232 RepID=UPI001653149F|nr:ankyrin repeat and zinc finger domain-containing protein 1 isoform X4 [Helianthus annuus]
MEFTSGDRAAVTHSDEHKRRHCSSIFKLPSNFTSSFRFIELLSSSSHQIETTSEKNFTIHTERWTCNTCNYSFDSLHDQRSHFKSDFHRFNIKLSIAGKDTIKEDDHDIISSISGSEDKDNRESGGHDDLSKGLMVSTKQKVSIRLPNGESISFWKCLLLGDNEKIRFEHDLSGPIKDDDTPFVTVREVIEKMLSVINEPRNNTCLRVILLASAGRFAGCVFDGNTVVTHKTFHRYVVRAKAGKKQSAEDAGGNIAHSAGASIRRHNELALTKDIRELLTAWKPYFDLSTAIFIHAPSHNRKQLFNGENPCFRCQKHVIRHIPLTVQRPTFKEAQRLYKILTRISTEPDEEISPVIKEDSTSTLVTENTNNNLEIENLLEDDLVKNVQRVHMSLPLHEAAKAGNAEKVLELLEQGSDPCVIDERGRTAYRLAAGKEVRNTFRHFMALNPDTWDWQAAKVPSPLTKEMEESQNVKQEGVPSSHQGTRWISSRVAGALVLVFGSLVMIAFGQMVKGRWWKKPQRTQDD